MNSIVAWTWLSRVAVRTRAIAAFCASDVMSTARWIKASSAALLISRIAWSSGEASRNFTSG